MLRMFTSRSSLKGGILIGKDSEYILRNIKKYSALLSFPKFLFLCLDSRTDLYRIPISRMPVTRAWNQKKERIVHFSFRHRIWSRNLLFLFIPAGSGLFVRPGDHPYPKGRDEDTIFHPEMVFDRNPYAFRSPLPGGF